MGNYAGVVHHDVESLRKVSTAASTAASTWDSSVTSQWT